MSKVRLKYAPEQLRFLPVSSSDKLKKGEQSLKSQLIQEPRCQDCVQLFVKKDGSKESRFPDNEIELLVYNE